MTLDLTISVLQDVTNRIRLFTLNPVRDDALPSYTPGAHVEFETSAGARSYSLIDWAPVDAAPASIQIAVQREDGGDGGSQAMHALMVGDQIKGTQPKNDFPLVDSDGPVILLAGGIGVTPLISHATELTARGRPFTFHYSARTQNAMAFKDRLLDAHGDNLRLWFDDTDPLDLTALFSDIDPATHLYVCGPKGMIEAAREAASLPAEQIHFELFTNDATQEGDQPFEVEINDGRIFTIPPGRSIIEVLENEGVDLIYDCQRGDCGICQTDVLEGTPDHRDVVLSQAERDAGDVMQICVSRANSDRLKLDI